MTGIGRAMAGVVAALVLVPALAWGLTDAEKCQAARLTEVSKYAACRLKADVKALKKRTAADYTTCDEKFAAKWAKIESRFDGACPCSDEQAAMQFFITERTDDLAAAVAGAPPPCMATRFVDNGDGTVTDNQTALMWEKKSALDDTENAANPHDADNRYHWSGVCLSKLSKRCQPNAAAAAACLANVDGEVTGCAACTEQEGACSVSSVTTVWDWVAQLNAASFAGYSDWRLPTREELETLLDLEDTEAPLVNAAFHGASCGSACTDITSAACSCTRSFWYWTATAPTPSTSVLTAWLTSFETGQTLESAQGSGDSLRAVRGGS